MDQDGSQTCQVWEVPEWMAQGVAGEAKFAAGTSNPREQGAVVGIKPAGPVED